MESALYKVTYTGELKHEIQKPVKNKKGKKERNLRKKLEVYQTKKDVNQLDFIVQNLDHKDRYIRFSSRVALENQDINSWKAKIYSESNVIKKTALAIAMAHQGTNEDRSIALNALLDLDWSSLRSIEKIDFLRSIELLIIRGNYELEASVKRRIKKMLLPFYLKESDIVNKQLCVLLSYLDTPEVLEPTIYKMENDTITSNLKSNYLSGDVTKRSDQYGKDVEKMLKNMPNQQNISYAKSLSEVKTGWTKDLRERYFRWYNKALKKSGGKQYANFIKAIQRRALENVPEEERTYFESLASEYMNQQIDLMKNVRPPKGPGKIWTVKEVENVFKANKENASFENGENFFRATLCVSCHGIKGVGGNSGPELTQVGGRFSIKDIAEAIIYPSKTVSDRYRNTIYHLNNNTIISGRLIEETENELVVSVNAFSPDITRTIKKEEIVKTEESLQSVMPPGLINSLNKQELTDLIAYLIAGGNKEHKIYKL